MFGSTVNGFTAQPAHHYRGPLHLGGAHLARPPLAQILIIHVQYYVIVTRINISWPPVVAQLQVRLEEMEAPSPHAHVQRLRSWQILFAADSI